MTTTVLATEWPSEIDAQELRDLADIAESHGLTDDAAQLRQAAEDVEVHIGYVNDLARLLDGDGNSFAGLEADSEWAVAFARVLHATAGGTADATMSLEVQTVYHDTEVSQGVAADATMSLGLQTVFHEADKVQGLDVGATMGVAIATRFLANKQIALDATLTPTVAATFGSGAAQTYRYHHH